MLPEFNVPCSGLPWKLLGSGGFVDAFGVSAAVNDVMGKLGPNSSPER